MSFPSYELDLPFEHSIIGYMYAANQAFVVIERNHSRQPFISYIVGLPTTEHLSNNTRPVFYGHYFDRRSDAFKDMTARALKTLC